jgi:hypothetical protein
MFRKRSGQKNKRVFKSKSDKGFLLALEDNIDDDNTPITPTH